MISVNACIINHFLGWHFSQQKRRESKHVPARTVDEPKVAFWKKTMSLKSQVLFHKLCGFAFSSLICISDFSLKITLSNMAMGGKHGMLKPWSAGEPGVVSCGKAEGSGHAVSFNMESPSSCVSLGIFLCFSLPGLTPICYLHHLSFRMLALHILFWLIFWLFFKLGKN